MIASVPQQELTQFRTLLAERLGLAFDDSKMATLARVLDGCSGGDRRRILTDLAGDGPADSLLARLASELTVTETYFYRSADQLRAFSELALPDRQQMRETVVVLSAGCASGEEPFSLAMVARECQRAPLLLTAFDANPTMLARAARARYSTWSLRELPIEQRRWFRHDGEHYELASEIQQAVQFERRNLALADKLFWRQERFDIIFCRNVLMYFTPEQAQAAVARIAHAMAPGGYLFLGHAETLRGLSNDFDLCHSHGTFYYQRKADTPTAFRTARDSVTEAPFRAQPSLMPSFLPVHDPLWADQIARASRRIDALATRVMPRPVDTTRAPDLQQALTSLGSEQFSKALEHIDNLSAVHTGDQDILLLKAVTLAQSGAVELARAACRELLLHDALHAGAHYVLALCDEHAGQLQSALDHYQGAAYLAPGFAMARLHAGRLLRRLGQRDAARRELALALLLLADEDASRLLLFGGGFPRAALLSLCQAEIVAAGGTP